MEIEEIIKEGLEKHFIKVTVRKLSVGAFNIVVRNNQKDYETVCYIEEDFQELAYDYLEFLAGEISGYISSLSNPDCFSNPVGI